MVASAQIAYPTFEEEEETEEIETEEIAEETIEEDKEETEASSETEAYVHAKSGRSFDISPEEFCGEPYAQQGDYETRLELGKKGEEAAVRFLQSKGYEILKRNWFCKFGEADIIARDSDGTLCFIEVKTRRSIEAGLPEEAITADKRKRYERIALAYMMVSDDWEDSEGLRFDAICICVTGPHRAMLRHHRGCFDASF